MLKTCKKLKVDVFLIYNLKQKTMKEIDGYNRDGNKIIVNLLDGEKVSFEMLSDKKETINQPDYIALYKSVSLDSRVILSMIVNIYFNK